MPKIRLMYQYYLKALNRSVCQRAAVTEAVDIDAERWDSVKTVFLSLSIWLARTFGKYHLFGAPQMNFHTVECT